MTTAGLKGIYQIARQAYLSADAGIGYNALNDRLHQRPLPLAVALFRRSRSGRDPGR